MVEGFKTRILG